MPVGPAIQPKSTLKLQTDMSSTVTGPYKNLGPHVNVTSGLFHIMNYIEKSKHIVFITFLELQHLSWAFQ